MSGWQSFAGILAYYFGFRNFSDRTSALESEISTLQVKYNDLKDKSDNIPKYKQDTETIIVF